MADLSPDFWLATGDMIYADATCPANRPDGQRNVAKTVPDVDRATVDWTNTAELREIYSQNWRYNRADPHLQRLLAATSVYSQWDDHEVINNFGGNWSYWNEQNRDRPGYEKVVATAREFFFHYAPLDRHLEDPNRIYRHFSWGRDMDLFILDARSYRSRNDVVDSAENAKTMLGPDQIEWLKAGLATSSATWKFIASELPLSARSADMPASGVDGWTGGLQRDFASRTGFSNELGDLLYFLDEHRVANVVFLAGDVHRALAIRYETDLDGDGAPIVFHEFVAGPLSANPGGPNNPQLHPRFNPVILYGEGNLFNFGHVRLEAGTSDLPRLFFAIFDQDGVQRPESVIELAPLTAR